MYLKTNDGNSSSIASISLLLQKLGMSKPPKNSTDLYKELKIAIGWEPSTTFCRKVKPDVPAYNSNINLTLDLKLLHHSLLMEELMKLCYLWYQYFHYLCKYVMAILYHISLNILVVIL